MFAHCITGTARQKQDLHFVCFSSQNLQSLCVGLVHKLLECIARRDSPQNDANFEPVRKMFQVLRVIIYGRLLRGMFAHCITGTALLKRIAWRDTRHTHTNYYSLLTMQPPKRLHNLVSKLANSQGLRRYTLRILSKQIVPWERWPVLKKISKAMLEKEKRCLWKFIYENTEKV